MFTRGASQGDRCLRGSPRPAPGDPKSVPTSSMCSLVKSTAWGWSYARSASPVRPSRSGWPTSSITFSASPGLRGEVRPHNADPAQKGRLANPKLAVQAHKTATCVLPPTHRTPVTPKSHGSSRSPAFPVGFSKLVAAAPQLPTGHARCGEGRVWLTPAFLFLPAVDRQISQDGCGV